MTTITLTPDQLASIIASAVSEAEALSSSEAVQNVEPVQVDNSQALREQYSSDASANAYLTRHGIRYSGLTYDQKIAKIELHKAGILNEAASVGNMASNVAKRSGRSQPSKVKTVARKVDGHVVNVLTGSNVPASGAYGAMHRNDFVTTHTLVLHAGTDTQTFGRLLSELPVGRMIVLQADVGRRVWNRKLYDLNYLPTDGAANHNERGWCQWEGSGKVFKLHFRNLRTAGKTGLPYGRFIERVK